MSAPTVMFVPWVFWHRPGGWWWNRHHHGPGRVPTVRDRVVLADLLPEVPEAAALAVRLGDHLAAGGGFGPGSFGGGHGGGFGGFGGGHGGGFGGGFGGGHGGGFGGGHGGGFGGGHH